MRVLFLSTRAPFPPDTGHFQRTYNVLRQASRFARVCFFGFYDRGVDGARAAHVRQALESLCEEVHLEHLAVERSRAALARLLVRSVLGTTPLVARKYLTPTMAAAVGERVARGGVDLVHLDMLPLAEYRPFLGRVPVVLTNHNVESLRLARWASVERNPLLRAFLHLQAGRLACYEARVIGALSHCITVSDSDAEYLARFNPGCRFHVVRNGTDLKWYVPQESGGVAVPTLLWIGNMADPYNRAGVAYFAESVFPAVQARVPGVRWVVVGKGAPAALRALARRHPGQVELVGYVDDVRPFYGAGHVLVVPLLSGSGTKLKVVEGLAAGMPIVTTPVGAEGLEFEDGRDLFVADGPDAFCALTCRLLQDPALRRRTGRQARALAEARYGWDGIGEALQRAYAEVMGA